VFLEVSARKCWLLTGEVGSALPWVTQRVGTLFLQIESTLDKLHYPGEKKLNDFLSDHSRVLQRIHDEIPVPILCPVASVLFSNLRIVTYKILIPRRNVVSIEFEYRGKESLPLMAQMPAAICLLHMFQFSNLQEKLPGRLSGDIGFFT